MAPMPAGTAQEPGSYVRAESPANGMPRRNGGLRARPSLSGSGRGRSRGDCGADPRSALKVGPPGIRMDGGRCRWTQTAVRRGSSPLPEDAPSERERRGARQGNGRCGSSVVARCSRCIRAGRPAGHPAARIMREGSSGTDIRTAARGDQAGSGPRRPRRTDTGGSIRAQPASTGLARRARRPDRAGLAPWRAGQRRRRAIRGERQGLPGRARILAGASRDGPRPTMASRPRARSDGRSPRPGGRATRGRAGRGNAARGTGGRQQGRRVARGTVGGRRRRRAGQAGTARVWRGPAAEAGARSAGLRRDSRIAAKAPPAGCGAVRRSAIGSPDGCRQSGRRRARGCPARRPAAQDP